MKEWCVVQFVQRGMIGIRYHNIGDEQRRLGVTGVYEIAYDESKGSGKSPDPYSNPLDSQIMCVFVDSEAEADNLITVLAKANPGKEYGKARVSNVAVCPPGEPVISKFTEKGLLPL